MTDGPLAWPLQVSPRQMQLGGPWVMGENGVSHYIAMTIWRASGAVLRWLELSAQARSWVPSHPLLPSNDPIEPARGVLPQSPMRELDPRGSHHR